jgi:hypothetical protein
MAEWLDWSTMDWLLPKIDWFEYRQSGNRARIEKLVPDMH